jgi:hypothetical protein
MKWCGRRNVHAKPDSSISFSTRWCQRPIGALRVARRCERRHLHDVLHAPPRGQRRLALCCKLHHVLRDSASAGTTFGRLRNAAGQRLLALLRSPADPGECPASAEPFFRSRVRARAGTPACESRRRTSPPIKPVLPVTRIIAGLQRRSVPVHASERSSTRHRGADCVLRTRPCCPCAGETKFHCRSPAKVANWSSPEPVAANRRLS